MGLCIVPFFLPVENENICLSLFFYHISNSLWRLRSTDHFPVLLWGSGLSAVNTLCPFPHFAGRRAVLINYFPSSGGIRFRPKRSPWCCLGSWRGSWHLLLALGKVHVTISLQKGGKVGFPGHLACPWYADQLRTQRSLFIPVFSFLCACGMWTECPGVGEGAEWRQW